MIALLDVCKQFGGRAILDSVRWRVNAGERVGLVGANGAGKSTLLKILCGLEEHDSGEVQVPKRLKLGYLAQEPPDLGDRPLHDVLWDGLAELRQRQTDLAALGELLQDAPASAMDDLVVQQARAVEAFEALGGYDAEARVARVASGLGFGQAALEDSVRSLSGGWQMRAALGRLLLAEPDVLVLDEPTNHLDIAVIEWLENYLLGLKSAVVVVSHDRAFLDRIATRITEVHEGKLSDWTGNYSDFLRQRQARDEALASAADRQERDLARAQAFIERFRASARRSKQAKSREKAVEKIERIEVPTRGPQVKFNFEAGPQSARLALDLRQVGKQYGDRQVLAGLEVGIERGMRVALVGPNGSGKSTLLRILAGEEQPDVGSVRLGQRVLAGYYAQHAADRLDLGATVIDAAYQAAPDRWTLYEVRSLLAGFLFRGDSVQKKVRVLSGGERARLALAILLLEPHNVLLLDEPTNHLDMDSKEVLAETLSRFTGTVLLASHDRYVLDRVATHVLALPSGTLLEGAYRDHAAALWAGGSGLSQSAGAAPVQSARSQASRTQGAPEQAAGGPHPTQASQVPASGLSGTVSYGATKPASTGGPSDERPKSPRFNAFKHARMLEDAEAKVLALEALTKDLADKLADPAFYAASSADAGNLARDYEAAQTELAEANAAWEALVEAASDA